MTNLAIKRIKVDEVVLSHVTRVNVNYLILTFTRKHGKNLEFSNMALNLWVN